MAVTLFLADLILTLKKGETFALLGVNGAGKTTALECIEGLRKYDSGTITINGKMGIQLQSSSLPAHIKPMEAVRLFSKWNRAKIDFTMLNALGMKEIEKKQYIQLSTGQKRRLHLALALIGDPDIIFLDEPTAGLDALGRVSLHELIRKLKSQGKTIVLTNHDMAEVENLCDRIVILNNGNIVFCGTATELTDKIGEKYFIHIKTQQGDSTFETDNIEDTLISLLHKLKQKGIHILDIKIDRGTLEQLMGGIFTSVMPEMRSTLIQSMIVMSVSMGAFVGLPPSLIETYGSDIKKFIKQTESLSV